MVRSGILAVVVLIAAGSRGGAQVAPAHDPELRKCKPCLAALGKSMAYLKANFDNPQTKRVIGSMLGGYVHAGFAFLMAGEGYQKELESCVRWIQQAVKDTGFNRNWYLGPGLFFLAEYSSRFGVTPQTRKAVFDAYKMAQEQQEESGGWCHHKEMWKEDGYHTKGGGRDLGMINVMMYSALLEFKALGIEPPAGMLDRVRKNLETIGAESGGGIIEVHLRFADQWPDLYGAGWVAALIRLYAEGHWSFDDGGRRDGYSVVLFGPPGRSWRHPPAGLVAEIAAMAGVSSVQITFHADRAPDLHAMPPGGFRLAIVNCWDLAAGRAARVRLAAWFGVVENNTIS